MSETQTDPNVICNWGSPPVHSDAGDTELAASESIAPHAPALRVQLLQWIRQAGPNGLTDQESAALLARERRCVATDSRAKNTISPRRVELRDGGFVEDSGLRRDGAIAWRATGKAGSGEVCIRKQYRKRENRPTAPPDFASLDSLGKVRRDAAAAALVTIRETADAEGGVILAHHSRPIIEDLVRCGLVAARLTVAGGDLVWNITLPSDGEGK
jgi:hypothetical protein